MGREDGRPELRLNPATPWLEMAGVGQIGVLERWNTKKKHQDIEELNANSPRERIRTESNRRVCPMENGGRQPLQEVWQRLAAHRECMTI